MLAAIVVTLLQFSDYHSHAVPFYAEEGADRGGIARAAGYLPAEKKRGALIFSGGDRVNQGSPARAEKYPGPEWPGLGGVVGDMAPGNPDPNQGAPEFAAARQT